MKKILTAVLVGVIAFSGCSGANGTGKDEKQRGTTERFDVTALPYSSMEYNDKKIPIKDVRLYQAHLETNYTYSPYVIIVFDASDLSDEDLHYLTTSDLMGQTRDAYLQISLEYSSESNKISYESPQLITTYTSGDDLVYCYYDYMHSDAIKPLDDMTVDLSVSIIQSHGELVKTYDDPDKKVYSLRINGENELHLDILNDSEIPEDENAMIEKGFGKIISRGF